MIAHAILCHIWQQCSASFQQYGNGTRAEPTGSLPRVFVETNGNATPSGRKLAFRSKYIVVAQYVFWAAVGSLNGNRHLVGNFRQCSMYIIVAQYVHETRLSGRKSKLIFIYGHTVIPTVAKGFRWNLHHLVGNFHQCSMYIIVAQYVHETLLSRWLQCSMYIIVAQYVLETLLSRWLLPLCFYDRTTPLLWVRSGSKKE